MARTTITEAKRLLQDRSHSTIKTVVFVSWRARSSIWRLLWAIKSNQIEKKFREYDLICGHTNLRGKNTGKERDPETGLDYFGARYMSAAQGRFTTPDPLMASAKASNPQTWNRYAYALNKPLRYVDPDGLGRA